MPSRVSLSEADARKQARKERAFYGNLASFVLVMTFLTALNLLTSPDSLWVVWPFLGWGIGIGSQAIATFGHIRHGDWIERRTAELMGTEADDDHLRSLLDEELDARRIPSGPPQDIARLQRRIEHLEAIVTATDDPSDPASRVALDLDALPEIGDSATDSPRRRDRA